MADSNFVEMMRHSCSHVMAQAVVELFPGTKLGIGPAIENGFYYDFDSPHRFVEEDLPKIEERMCSIIKERQPFLRSVHPKEEALARFEGEGEIYKVELINDLPPGEISFYANGSFTDLCRGPHVEHTGLIKHFKLTSVAGAYWRGDEKRPMLQRIYAIAFETKEELEAYLKQQEEADKRDHRKVGRQMDLYSVNELVGPGLVLWHPKGARIRHAIETYWKDEHLANGYDFIYTPHIGREILWKTSGHLDFYKDAMYSPMDIDGIAYYAKPMNCPFHIQIYQSAGRSYRDLPLRWAELGTVYRFEKAGVLHGLMRVRGFTQDDAHIICTPEQIEDEMREVLRFSLNIWKTFGFTEIKAYLATMPEGAVGEPARWEQAQKSLFSAAQKENLPVEIDEGGGAFYGPKIDLKVKDAIGREWQTTTIQFDFNLPERFKMEYIGSDGHHHQPYMVHRALLGSLERFFGILIEHYGGHFPLWLAPVQARVLSLTSAEEPYAREIASALKKAGLRAETDFRSDKIGLKIRQAHAEKIPYMIIAGEKEAQSRTIALRLRGGKSLYGVSLDELMKTLLAEIAEKKLSSPLA